MQKAQKPRLPWPRGVYYGWAIVTVAFLVSFVQVGAHNHPLGFFMRPMQAEFGWSRGQIAAAAGIGSVGGAVMAALLGRWLDRRGTRGAVVAASLALGVCLVLLSTIHALWQYYLVYGLARAVSVGAMELSLGVAVANWFIAKRARAMGLALIGRRLAIALLPLLASIMIVLWDWRRAWLGLGVLVLVLAVAPAALLLRRRPEDVGLLPDGQTARGSGAAPGVASAEESWTLREAMGTPAFWLLAIASALAMAVSGSVNLHQTPHLLDVGISPGAAAAVVAVFALSGVGGNMLFGMLAERWAIRYVICLGLVGSAVGMALLIITRSTWMAFIYAAWYGVSFGGLWTLLGIVFANYFGRGATGAINSFSLTANLAANAIGPTFAGMMYDVQGSYTVVFLIFLAIFLLNAVMVLLARPPQRRWARAAAADAPASALDAPGR